MSVSSIARCPTHHHTTNPCRMLMLCHVPHILHITCPRTNASSSVIAIIIIPFSPHVLYFLYIYFIIVLWSCLIAQNVVKMCPLCILKSLLYRKLNPRCNYVWSVNWILPHRATSSHPWTRTRWTLRSSSLSAPTSPVCAWWTPRARSWGMRWATGRSTRSATIEIGLRASHRIILRYGSCLINYGERTRNIPIQG